MRSIVRIVASGLVLGGICVAPAFAQALPGVVPTTDNGGLIPPYLVEWLIPVGGIISAIACVVTDKALRAERR